MSLEDLDLNNDMEQDDELKIKFLWHDTSENIIKLMLSDADRKNQNPVNIKELKEKIKNIIDSKKSECEKIYYLGVGISSGGVGGFRDPRHSFGVGLLYGWLIRAIKDSQEKDGKILEIQHDKRQISKEEFKEMAASAFEKLAKEIRDSEEKESESILNGEINDPIFN